MRNAGDGAVRLGQCGLFLFQEGQACGDALGGVIDGNARGDDAGDHRRCQLAGSRQQPFRVRQRPFAFLVELADDPRPRRFAPVVELFLELVFEELALLLDDQDLFQPFGECAHAFGLQRPDHAHLVQAQADFRRHRVVDAQVFQGLAHIEIALAAGDDAQARRRAVDDHLVQLVGAAVGERGVELVVQQAFLLHQGWIGPAQIEAVGRQGEGAGDDGFDGKGVDVHRCRGLDGVGQRLERHPATGIARQRETVEAQFQVFLDVGRGQHRHHQRLEHVLGLMR